MRLVQPEYTVATAAGVATPRATNASDSRRSAHRTRASMVAACSGWDEVMVAPVGLAAGAL